MFALEAMTDVAFSSRALRDLRRIGLGPERRRIITAIEEMAAGSPTADVKALAGASPWRRLRVGDWRALFRPRDDGGWWVERVVNRGELERAVAKL